MRALIKLAIAAASFSISLCGHAQTSAPSFEQFPITERFAKPAAPPYLKRQRDREFRTALNEAAKKPVNFAGHYVLTTIGCGASCVLVAALDAKTGRVAWLPFTLCCWNVSIPEPVLFRLDSDLLILNGQRNEAGAPGPHYFRFTRGRFAELDSR